MKAQDPTLWNVTRTRFQRDGVFAEDRPGRMVADSEEAAFPRSVPRSGLVSADLDLMTEAGTRIPFRRGTRLRVIRNRLMIALA
jgi:hypothetical protein